MECSDVHMHDEQILCDTESNRIKPDMSVCVCVCVRADERQGIRAVRCSAVRCGGWVGGCAGGVQKPYSDTYIPVQPNLPPQNQRR